MINDTPLVTPTGRRIVATQEVRLGRQKENSGGIHHQRRRQRSLLQGTWATGHQGDRHSGCASRSVREKQNSPHRTKAAAGHLAACGKYLESIKDPPPKRSSSRKCRLHPNPKRGDQTIRWKRT